MLGTSSGDAGGGVDIDALTQFEQETMGNTPGVMNALTGFTYNLDEVEFVPVSADELPDLLGSDLLFASKLSVDAEYWHFLVLERQFAIQIAAALTGTELEGDAELGEMELSAIQEAVSQVNGTYLTNLSSALKQPASGESLETAEVAEIGDKLGDGAMLGTLQLKNDQGETVQLRHILGGSFVQRIGESMEPEPEPQAAPEPEPQAAEPQAEEPQHQAAAGGGQSSGNVMSPTSQVQQAAFSQLSGAQPAVTPRNLEMLLDVPLQVTVELGKSLIPIRQILEYGQGSLITLDKLAGEPIDLLVNGKYFAKGEVVVIDENFGVRITSILTPQERIAQFL